MKQTILSGWNLYRVLSLVRGLMVVVQSIILKDVFFGLMGLLLSGLAILNIGCCGVGGCQVNTRGNHEHKTTDISYEEVTDRK